VFTFADEDSCNEAVRAAFMAGAPYDVMPNGAAFGVSPADIYKLGREGYLRDIFELFYDDVNGGIDDYFTNILDGAARDGKLYDFPLNAAYNVIGINKNLTGSAYDEFIKYNAVSVPDMINLYKNSGCANNYNMCANLLINDFIDGEINNCTKNQEITFTSQQFIDQLNAFKDVIGGAWTPLNDELLSKQPLTLDNENDLSNNYMFIETDFSQPNALFMYSDPQFEHFIPLTDSSGYVIINYTYSFYVSAQADEALALAFLKNAEAAYNAQGLLRMLNMSITPNKALFNKNITGALSNVCDYALGNMPFWGTVTIDGVAQAKVITTPSETLTKIAGSEDAVFVPEINGVQALTWDYPMRDEQIAYAVQNIEDTTNLIISHPKFSLDNLNFLSNTPAKFLYGSISAEELANEIQSAAEDYLAK